MKNFTLVLICLLFLALQSVKAQQQVNNSGFELWDNQGSANEEPTDWNSFKTASGTMALYASQQIIQSTQKRPGSLGNYSCVIWSKSIIGIIANGNVTTGQINMGSATPANSANYNVTHTAQPGFSEALGNTPDSIAIWVRFKPANAGGTDSARVHACVHDTYDFRDPIDAGSAPHLVAEATLNFASTNNIWVRKSFPFVHSGPATSPDYILISITTNKTPGSGSGGDSLYVDDLQLIYNGISVPEINAPQKLNVYSDASDIIINLAFDKPTLSHITIYNVNGQVVYQNQITASQTREKVNINPFVKGIYLVSVVTEDGQRLAAKIAVK